MKTDRDVDPKDIPAFILIATGGPNRCSDRNNDHNDYKKKKVSDGDKIYKKDSLSKK